MRLEEAARGNDLQGAVILLVEDNEEDIVLMKRAFRNAHIANPLRVVKDGEEAIQYLAGNGPYADRARHPMPFLVLLDLRLPKLSGFEVLAWIRDQTELAELIVVVLTGSDHVPDATKARELGANSYMVKPGTFEELMELVKRINCRWVLLDQSPDFPASRETPRARL